MNVEGVKVEVPVQKFITEDQKAYETVESTIYIDIATVIYKAEVLEGTFSLAEKVKTLKSYKKEYEQAKTGRERFRRAAIALLAVSVLVGVVVAAVMSGGGEAFAFSFMAGSVISLVMDCILANTDEVPGTGIYLNLFVLLTLPIAAMHWAITHESEQEKRVEKCEAEVAAIKFYLKEKKNVIQNWLENQEDRISEQITKEGNLLQQNPKSINKDILAKLENLENSLCRVKQLKVDLKSSYAACQESADF